MVLPRNSANVVLPYNLNDSMETKDVMLNVEYRLKKDEGLLKAGDIVAHQQLPLRECKGTDLHLSDSDVQALKGIKLSDKKKDAQITFQAPNFTLQFNRQT